MGASYIPLYQNNVCQTRHTTAIKGDCDSVSGHIHANIITFKQNQWKQFDNTDLQYVNTFEYIDALLLKAQLSRKTARHCRGYPPGHLRNISAPPNPITRSERTRTHTDTHAHTNTHSHKQTPAHIRTGDAHPHTRKTQARLSKCLSAGIARLDGV